MNDQKEATAQQQQFQEMMTAQINAMQQQLATKQGATATAMQQSAAAIVSNQRASTPTISNRTNNRGGNWHRQAWGNMQQATYCPPTFSAMQTSGSNTQANPRCIFENQNYCYTHGYHVKNDHTSQTCKTPDPSHNPNTTKFNTMSGSNARAHKTIMLSQHGRQTSVRPQREPVP